MRWTSRFHMNIRQRIIVGMAVIMSMMAALGGFSYRYLREVEIKQHFVEVADDLSNIILEMRRYEKNFLLYGYPEDLEQNRRYVRQGTEMLATIFPEVKDFEGAPVLDRLERELKSYSVVMEEIARRKASEGPAGYVDVPRAGEQLRERGKALVDLSGQLVSFERRRILDIIRSLKAQLLFSVVIFLALGLFLTTVVTSKIIRPLRVIEKTTRRIAQGDFRPLPVRDTRDETQRVVEAFNRMVAELERRQDQLLQAKKLASLGTLTSGIAHQLNNPLNNISTSCQILLEEQSQAGLEFHRKMLTNIEQEVHRARDIVRGLLDFSRIREFCLAPTPLSQVVDRSVSLISSQVPPGIEIVREIPANLTLDLDAQRMQQVFLNLIENAVQAMKPPGQIRIAAAPGLDGKSLVITVEDTGAGIPEKDLGWVFDPFFSTKEVGLGTGLGLSIVYGIVQKHQGSISVESREGEGTRFTIRLPVEAHS